MNLKTGRGFSFESNYLVVTFTKPINNKLFNNKLLKMKTSIIALTFLISLISCNKASTPIVACGTSITVLSSKDFTTATTDDFLITDAEIIGDCLEVTVRVGGGCGELYFSLIANENVIETLPEQQMIKLILDDQDFCKALLEEKRSFDLASLKIGTHGTLILLLDEFDNSIEYKY